MLNTLKKLLAKSGADAWEITETEETGWEFYLIRHRLDQHRAKQVKTIQVKVYRKLEEGKLLGSAGASLPPDATETEMQKLIDGLYEDAGYVRNPFYRLNVPAETAAQENSPESDLAAISRDFLKTMRSLKETDTEDLNSYEIFVSEIRKHYLNSEGVDVVSRNPVSMLEAVVNARKDGQEIELYRMYDSGTCDGEQLAHDLNVTLQIGRDRLETKPTPAIGKADAVFSTEAAREIYWYFIDRVSTGMIYQKMSDWEIGKDICPEREGDAVTVRALRFLPNSSRNEAYDREGAPVRDLTLLEDGVPQHLWGSRQFSQYLGVEDAFLPGNFEVTGGTATEAEIRQGDYLEVMEFSDFQVDSMNGDLAGEIRLAYWHKDGKRIPVSGGSISGNMRDFLAGMRMSRDSRQYDRMRIPALTRLKNVSVTGAE